MNEIQLHTLLEKALRYVEDGKLLHAAQLYVRVMQAAPTLDEPYLRLSQLYFEMGRTDLAEGILANGYARAPGNASFMTVLGDLYMRRGGYEEAVECLKKLANRRLPYVHFTLGVAYMHLGKLKEAEAELRTALLLDQRWPEAYEVLGELLIRKKQFGEAIKELEQGLRLEPYSAAGHRLIGIAAVNRFEFQKALDHLVLAVDMDPDDASAWQLCGDVLLRMRRFEEAEPYLRKALKLNPRSADVSASLGYLCLHRGETTKALHAFNRALQLQPGHPRAVDGKLQLKIHNTRVL